MPPESAAATNGDSNADADKPAEDAESAAEKSDETESKQEAAAKETEEDEDGPSPNKRIKTDSETESKAGAAVAAAEKAKPAEDEYEDVVPVPRDTVALLSGYVLIALVPVEQLVAGPRRAESRKECEVILLVGLPGAGKTHWTQKHVSENLDKRYEIIGPDSIIAKMTVSI